MKVNKKIIVPFLSAVIGLSVSGGIGGAFAWYQYNSQVTASYVGTSVADTSVLQIGHKVNDNMVWERDFVQLNPSKLVPVTFGALAENDALSGNAYGYPEAGKQLADNYSSWSVIDPNADSGYVQFDVYLRAIKADKTPVALDVYLTDIAILDNDVTANDGINQSVSDAMRIHLAVEGDANPNRLISKTTIDEEHKLALFGGLDLDGDNVNDKKGGYSWAEDRETDIVYGKSGDYQTTTGISDIVQARGSDGLIPTNNDKKICTTKSTQLGTDADYVKITVTIWLEGWALLNKDAENKSNVWNPAYTASGVQARVGMTFDTGRVRV